ncbi:hypothetical protein ABID08_003053 [Rhizobium binae]|uniref:Uncharacterized protein n=1 Tax=Rhizobium binae TaxID=1138190 RepID=A0ABV2MK24_9HYPH|nr:hypothetical protein [Rhizobium binae]MBX4995172.1 hypothetical protein [Rhizobium binae]NKL48910.1 hypothetical protein [Rhizobium leguminosarum bv. viciae]QSY85772.1 hypothetical protein J2J99_27545 [Rhizobium binae]
MAYKVQIYVTKSYTITVKDWLSGSPCVDAKTGEEIKDVAITAPATLETAVGLRNGVGGVVIEEKTTGTTMYDIPRELDSGGKITFPKGEAVSQNDLDQLAERVEVLKQEVGDLRQEIERLK